ncbi:GerMN domain-containing protein [Pelosinus sp. UFO1]|uniref:GerMN domain-containing protein n=1 Tax=Pelosinus sp. UFO1 TaxID=484770 RepID=UPI0004D1A1E2|nr:GerMN domain-containing protein [Pelosinus sp. UFO1]AIF50830.1 Lipoprotein LpqB, GerMN domain-containing protein [Pelosinus sp. UFO1]
MMFRKRIFLFIMLLLMTVMLGGCDNTTQQPPVPLQNENPQQQAAPIEGGTVTPSSVGQDTMKMTVYYSTKDALNLVGEQYVVPKNTHPAQTAMELLVAGTKNPELISVVPAGTKLRNISVKEHIAYVDFSDQLVKNNKGGSASEILLVASIVNTLTEFHDIKKVQILVEGKKIDTISGHMDIGEPLSRSEKIIKK